MNAKRGKWLAAALALGLGAVLVVHAERWPSFVWFGVIPLLAFLGLPVFAVLALIPLIAFSAQSISSSAVVTEMLRIAATPILIPIPLFTFAGYLFAEANTPQRLVRLTRAAFGWIPGGLAIVALVACSIFTAFTGASGVTIIAFGGLIMPALLAENYSKRFSLGLLTTCGSLGILFPPSLALILYSFIANQTAAGTIADPLRGPSVDRLFLAGILPGFLLIIALSLLALRQGRRTATPTTPFNLNELLGALRAAAWEIPLPAILLGGIYGGRLTVTEAAAMTALYAFVVEVLIYRDIPLRRLPAITAESMQLVGGHLIIIAGALGLTNYLIDAEVPARILGGIENVLTSRFAFLLALNGLLLVVGCLMDVFSALLVVVPLIVPVAQRYGVDLTHLGIIFLMNLEIGYSAPPAGLNLFISSFRFRRPIMDVAVASLPFILTMLITLLIVTYLPGLSLLLPSLLK